MSTIQQYVKTPIKELYELKYDYETWEYEEEAIDIVEEYEEESESSEEFDISEEIELDELTEDQRKEMRKKKKKKQLSKLVGIIRKKEEDVSVETLITPEEMDDTLKSLPSESSIHLCLKKIDISDSQLKLLNLHTVFPIPNDPGVAPAFWMIAAEEIFEENGVYKFNEHLKSRGLKVIHTIADMLNTDCINLRYYGIDPRIVEIIYYALKNNASVQIIDLTDNWLPKSACYYLGKLIQDNMMIISLILSKCRIGPEGMKELCDGISTTMSLITLNLNSCNIEDKGLEVLAIAIENNESLEELFLANNNLNKTCTEHLCYLIMNSKSIKWLDLSWNSLFDEHIWKALTGVLVRNRTLVGLNLSWNGIGAECVKYLTIVLRFSHLETLDLSSNMFTKSDAENMSKSLSRNSILQELYLGNNRLGAEGAFMLVSSVTPKNSPESSLRLLNLENVWADKIILPELDTIENERPWLQIVLGGIYSNYTLVGPDVMTILLRRATYEAMKQKKKKHRKNFGHFVLSLSDHPMSRERFRKLIRDFKLKLSKSLIKEIISAFPGPKRTVDLGLLKAVYLKEFPDTKPPPVKPSKLFIEKEEEVIEPEKPEVKKEYKYPDAKEIRDEVEEYVIDDFYEGYYYKYQ
ncbi:leucine-rich repeat-containing protein 74B-like [Vespula squamosa]|uniref:Leucine-rich repeat-containing protein 74B-like n=1 Tax=Vespula squamosa TaxID=30214 RepID=A0ABD2BE13_VESSQ